MNVFMNYSLLFCFSLASSQMAGMQLSLHTSKYAKSIKKLTKISTRNYSDNSVDNKINDLIRAIPASVVKSYKSKYPTTSAPHEDIIKEWVRFAYLAKKYGNGMSMFSEEVDAFWHNFILHTREYQTYCAIHLDPDSKQKEEKQSFFNWISIFINGSQPVAPPHSSMLHHTPYDENQSCPIQCHKEKKVYFRKLYINTFDNNPSEEMWPSLTICKECPSENQKQQKVVTLPTEASGNASASSSSSSCGSLFTGTWCGSSCSSCSSCSSD